MDVGAGHFILLFGNIGKNPLEFFKWQGHGRRAEGGDPPLHQAFGHGLKRLGCGLSRIMPSTAVDMHVDQAGNDRQARQIQLFRRRRGIVDGPDTGSLHRDVGLDRLENLVIDDRVFQQHAAFLRFFR